MAAWTKQKTAALRSMVMKGYTEGEISHELKVTPHAVANKIVREGFTRLRPMPRRVVTCRPLPRPTADPVMSATVRMLDAKSRQCRWIVGEIDGANTRVCGKPISYRSWCAEHARAGYIGRDRHA